MRAPFILYKRSSGAKGGKVYHAAFWDEKKKDYTLRRSTGQTSKANAKAVAQAMLDEGLRPRSSVTFLPYLESFWADDGPYAVAWLARGGKPISGAYLSNSRGHIKNHVRPYMEATKTTGIQIEDVTPSFIEDLIMDLSEKDTISHRTINAVRQAISVPLSEAARLRVIKENPVERVPKLHETLLKRGIVSVEESTKLFAVQWPDPRHQVINALAATTGMRLGECLGLLPDDVRFKVDEKGIKKFHIHVCHNWQPREGMKGPKWGSIRDVPVTDFLVTLLATIASMNPHKDGFIFFGDKAGTPMAGRMVAINFSAALERIGITKEERKDRHLTFHSWRHFFNSELRDRGLADHTLKELTGHHSEKMTDDYSHITDEQMKAVAALTNSLDIGKTPLMITAQKPAKKVL